MTKPVRIPQDRRQPPPLSFNVYSESTPVSEGVAQPAGHDPILRQ
jgi:hypothetical protein